jgi:hypothetical protein
MKYPILVPLAAAALLSGCIRPPDDGGTSERFKLEFNPVRSVIVDSWGYPQPMNTTGGIAYPDPIDPPTYARTVRVEGQGLVNGERGSISLSYAISIDGIGCKALAEQAQQEGRILEVEGFGTVAELAVALAQMCYPPETGGGSVGGSGGNTGSGTVTSSGGTTASTGIACPQPVPPVQSDGTNATSPIAWCPCGCPCGQPFNSFLVRAEKLASCALGGKVILPPDPGPVGPPTPAPTPTAQPL